MYAIYMVTFTINIPQMLAYIPYMDPMGIGNILWWNPRAQRYLLGRCEWGPPTSGSPMPTFRQPLVPKKAHETPDGMGGFLKSLPENTVSEVSGSLESEFGSKHLKTNWHSVLVHSFHVQPVLCGMVMGFFHGKTWLQLTMIGGWGKWCMAARVYHKKVVVSVKMLRLYPNLGR